MVSSRGLPWVKVPVLSKTTQSTLWASSRAAISLMRIPDRAALPVPTMMAVGVASPNAQGQAITSTATLLRMALCQSPPSSPHNNRVSRAIPSTTGTNRALILSTSRCTGALPACADSTRAMMRESMLLAPRLSAITSSRPLPLMAPPMTRCPTPLSTGKLSPVSRDSSTWLIPSTTTPSTGMRSPGRITTLSPTTSSARGRVTICPARTTLAISGRRACKAAMALRVWRLARSSSHLPSNTRVITVAEASK